MTGGAAPAFPVTVKVSVEHWVSWVIGAPISAPMVGTPKFIFPIVVPTVLGPAMTNVLKSTRS
jgi:hypothetical protein